MGSPILPRTLDDPTGQDARERRAIADFKSRMLNIQRGMLRILDAQPYQVITINAAELALNETIYRFELDENILDRINAEIGILIDAILLQGGQRALWFMDLYVQPAYQQGTAQSVANLSVQSAEYALSRPALESVLLSDPYRKRIGLVRAREFENMQNLTAWMKNDLSRTLSQGMSLGQNPRVIAKSIRERIGVSQSRAATIARTEIPNALRQARMDETVSAQESLGIQTKEMHLSAFSPTTRPDHAARHSRLFSIQEQKEWWARDANSINCKCSTVSILIGDDGEPLTPSIIERAKKMRR
jgi:SPP1 gp7 family putative phage head morphogenesis protein